MLKKIFYLLFIIFILGLSSCRKDERYQEVTDDPSPRTEESKNKNEEHPADTSKVSIEQTDEKPVAVISPVEAKEYNGKFVTVNGFVADVFKNKKVAYLNFTEKYPKNPFSVVIFESKFSEFGILNEYENRFVEVNGRISVYKGKPQIILNSPEQIKIVK